MQSTYYTQIFDQAQSGNPEAIEFLLIQMLEDRLTTQQKGELQGRVYNKRKGDEKFIMAVRSALALQERNESLEECRAKWEQKKEIDSTEKRLFVGTLFAFSISSEDEPHDEVARKMLSELERDPATPPKIVTLSKIPLAKALTFQASPMKQTELQKEQLLAEVVSSGDVGPPMKTQARFYKAETFEKGLDFAKALTEFAQIADDPGAPDTLQAIALERIASLHDRLAEEVLQIDEKAYQQEKALKFYLMAHGHPGLLVRLYYKVAKRAAILHENRGEEQESRKLLEAIVSHPQLTAREKNGAKYAIMRQSYQQRTKNPLFADEALKLARELIDSGDERPYEFESEIYRWAGKLCENTLPEEAVKYFVDYLELARTDDPNIDDVKKRLFKLALKGRNYQVALYYGFNKDQLQSGKIPKNTLEMIPECDRPAVQSMASYHFMMHFQRLQIVELLFESGRLPSASPLSIEQLMRFLFQEDPRCHHEAKMDVVKAFFSSHASFDGWLPTERIGLEQAGRLLYKLMDSCIDKIDAHKNYVDVYDDPYDPVLVNTSLQEAYRWFKEVPKASTYKALAWSLLLPALHAYYSEKLSLEESRSRLKIHVKKATRYLNDLQLDLFALDTIRPGVNQEAIAHLTEAILKCKESPIDKQHGTPSAATKKRKETENTSAL